MWRRGLAVGGIDPAQGLALQHGMTGDEQAALEDPEFRGVVLNLEHPLPHGVGHRIEDAADRDHAVLADTPLAGQHRIVGDGGQRPQTEPLLDVRVKSRRLAAIGRRLALPLA